MYANKNEANRVNKTTSLRSIARARKGKEVRIPFSKKKETGGADVTLLIIDHSRYSGARTTHTTEPYTACLVGWFISLLVREEVLLTGLCERKILFRLEIYDRLRQATAKRTGRHLQADETKVWNHFRA